MRPEGRNLSFEFQRIDMSARYTLFFNFPHPNDNFEKFSFIILKESTAWPAAGPVPEGFLKVSLRIY